MLTYKNNSDVAVIVFHEIYGLNQHIIGVCEKLSEYEVDILAPNMLQRNIVYPYNQEERAYRNFINGIGFEKAFKQMKEFLYNIRKDYRKIYLIGYSIGATIAWLCSDEPHLCDGVIGFYGSRIRNYGEVVPQCPVLLYFPAQEKSFSVDELMQSLKGKDNIQLRKLDGKHGFADPFSKQYNKESAVQAYGAMISFIKQH
jgi:dienelactone hydrolase